MITSCEIVNVPEQPIAELHLQISASDARSCMGTGLSEVLSALSAQSIEPAGPWLTLHFKIPNDTWDFSICLPLPASSGFKEHGRVAPGTIPADKVARCVYVGGYEGLPAAWGEFMNWVEGTGSRSKFKGFWEVYTVNPDNVGQKGGEFRTELNCPLE